MAEVIQVGVCVCAGHSDGKHSVPVPSIDVIPNGKTGNRHEGTCTNCKCRVDVTTESLARTYAGINASKAGEQASSEV